MNGVYLNEWDDFPAAGLAAMYPNATVDTTSVVLLNRTDHGPHPAGVPVDVDLSFTQCHFFAGIGGWPAALAMAGWPDDRPVWTGSCPCQPFSSAGKRRGTADERHLWPDFLRQIQRFRPPEVFGEQVASPDGVEWLDRVQSDLEAAGYFFWPVDLAAASVGSPIIRQRLFWGARRRDVCGSDLQYPSTARDGAGCGDALRSGSGGLQRSPSDGWDERGPASDRRGVASGRSGVSGDLSGPASCGLGRRTGASGARADGSEAADDCESVRSVGGSGGAGLSQRTGDGGIQRGAGCSLAREASELSGDSGSDELGLPCGERSHEQPVLRRRVGETYGASSSGSQHSTRNHQPGFWSDYAIAWFRDDKRPGQFKARRIEPGLVPVAYGIPSKHADILPRLSQLGLDAECAKRCIALAKRHRVGTIRGYGNAIVLQVAAQLLRVWLEEFPTYETEK